MFKINVESSSLNKIYDSSQSIVYNSESCDVWHGRLDYVNLQSIRKMTSLNLIPKIQINFDSKCEICAQTKQPRKQFKSIEFRNSQILELIHSDVCDSNRGLSRGESRYFVTFIDDYSRYCYTYISFENKR